MENGSPLAGISGRRGGTQKSILRATGVEMKAYVDQDACIGCALCPSLCPEVFEMNENDKAQAIEEDIPKEANESAVHARNNCPVDAISIQ